jgi:hypothetical protein
VFASWRAQPFPARAVITNQVHPSDKAPYRAVWLTFATPKGDTVVLERAYDVQNVCIDGRREI